MTIPNYCAFLEAGVSPLVDTRPLFLEPGSEGPAVQRRETNLGLDLFGGRCGASSPLCSRRSRISVRRLPVTCVSAVSFQNLPHIKHTSAIQLASPINRCFSEFGISLAFPERDLEQHADCRGTGRDLMARRPRFNFRNQ